MPSGNLSGQVGYVQGGFVLNKLHLFEDFRSGGGGEGAGVCGEGSDPLRAPSLNY